jgi:hypothetical protein
MELMGKNQSVRFWLSIAILLLPPFGTLAASSACDPSILQNHEHPEGYRDREGQLCEGMYATGVSSMGLMLASFTGPMQGINLARKADFKFHWKPVGQGDIRVRADSLRPRLYYRMDAVRPANETHLSWNNAIPAHYEMRTSEFGIIATQKDASGNLLYLPLQVSQNGKSASKGSYVVTVISGAEIEEIYWSLSMEGQEQHIVYDEPLDRRPYAANQPISIELDKVVVPGKYLLNISAELVNGSFDTVTVPFYYSP